MSDKAWRNGSSRREFLGGLAAAGAGMFVAGCSGGTADSAAQAPAASGVDLSNVRLFDLHHHFASPTWIKKASEDGAINPTWEGYTPAKTVEWMDQAGIDVAFASQTTPGVWLAEGYGNSNAASRNAASIKASRQTIEEARALVREMNEFGAKMVSDYPRRFAILAALALPDVDGSLREIEYIYDTLKLQGIGLLTSYGNRWMGDPMFTPIFEELNRRKAIVYTHPTAALCCRGLLPGVGETTLEFSTDTARTIISWISSGAAKRFPDIRWIHSHGGGTLMTARFVGANLRGTPEPDSELYYLRQYFYDTNASSEATLWSLKRTVGASQVVFGHFDIPQARLGEPGAGHARLQQIKGTEVFTDAELRGIAYENALRLFPEFATTT
jgi:predicted TIM-barrel fold metal-dependent hydrolase